MDLKLEIIYNLQLMQVSMFEPVDISTVAKALAALKKNGVIDQIPALIYKILETLILAPLNQPEYSIKTPFLNLGKKL